MKKTAIMVVLGSSALSMAGGPTNQYATFGSIVRVMSGVSDKTSFGNFLGTGTIIANKNINGKGWLAVLTADHVVSKNEKASGASIDNPGIGLGNAISGSSAGFPAKFLARMGSQKVDIAVLGFEYGDYIPGLKSVRTIAAVDPNSLPASFTSLGYGTGLDADIPNSMWKSNGVAGELRFYNNKKYTISAGKVATFGEYENQIVDYKALAPGHADGMLGQGVMYRGDSGGPLMTTTPDKETVDGKDIPIMSNGIFAINHSAVMQKVNGVFTGIKFDAQTTGVFLNADYRQWINQQIQAVPEPASALSLLALAGGLARRRSQKRS